MTETIKNTIIVKGEEFLTLTEPEKALILILQELTQSIDALKSSFKRFK